MIRAEPGDEPLAVARSCRRGQMDYGRSRGGGYEIAPWALTELLVRLRDDYGAPPI